MFTLRGVPIHINPFLDEQEFRQFRFPRSKKKRIRKKWAKDRWNNYRMVTIPGKTVMMNGVMYMGPKTFEAVKQHIDKEHH